ncbi:hypothetical protein PUN28_017313 [Cardiocondyla obscurior]|uniref:Secreted protein n=1 Tax=Cardiocondyla obscurior TaxID=286306 RepID=A0AAW2EQ56_9HYME
MGWLIACQQACFFHRLSFLAFPPSVIFPSIVRTPAIRHPFSLRSSAPLCTTFVLTSRHARGPPKNAFVKIVYLPTVFCTSSLFIRQYVAISRK